MPYATILVDLSQDVGSDAAVRAAAGLARTHGSHLVGIAATGTVDTDFSWAASRSLQEAHGARDAAALLASRRAERFQALCTALHLPSFEALAIEGDRAGVLLHRSHTSDLTVIGQAGSGRAGRDERQVVERVLLHNARPTLLVPSASSARQGAAIGERVLIAWDDSAACARAVGDAMPLLRRAREVHLRIWLPASDAEGAQAAMQARLGEIDPWLSRQGVRVQARLERAGQAVGDEIMRAAASLDCDLVVMGTYSHSRWTERILGGATRTALQHAKVPLWMAH
jgi:nucleotide-binding universal stress UspA family protein